ncbi:hypothetical protein CPB86DRAFT_786903 [Serendipita vermifera]|nr:hypothetical protein CPB86DRAFT_786903 [Serendipita vermifera]
MDSFPVELIQEILYHLRPPISTTEASEANTKFMYDAWNWWSPRPVFSDAEETTVATERADSWRTEDPRQRYLEILPLRLVNRAFRDICTPFVYQEMTLFDWADDKTLHVASQYGNYLRSLRIMVKGDTGNEEDVRHPEDRLLRIISLCPEIRSIAFYYFPPPLPMWLTFFPTRMMDSILQLKKLNTVGIYTVIQHEIELQRLRSTVSQIEAIAQSDEATAITRLDLSVALVGKKICKLLLDRYTSLEQLSLHGVLLGLGRGRSDLLDWSRFRRLTSLNLSGDPSTSQAFSGGIPEVVRACISLKRLSVSDQGTSISYWDSRQVGWSSEKDAWWNQRTPLEYFQLDVQKHFIAIFSGTIPVHEMKLIVRERSRFDGLFNIDQEVFPHLHILTVHSVYVQEEYIQRPDIIWTEPLCRLREGRGVTLLFEGIHADGETRTSEE